MDAGYHKEYRKFIDDLIREGHAEEVPVNDQPGKVWYIPHFSVRHKQKGKLRVVMDASAKFNGISLNNMLLTGPDHMNSLVGILLRFRKKPVAITSDIQKMFYNFLVEPQHRDYLRFLWIDENMENIKDYRMNVHLFGATSSPGVATFGLRRLAEDYSSISTKAAEFLKRDFYVDDGVTSVETVQEAKELIEAATKICSKGNVRLHKFLSNNKEVLSSVPESERSESTKNLNLVHDQLPQERTLGLEWSAETDSFTFALPHFNKPTTKRGLLSTISQIYDPLGLISPVILKGKQILQRVVASELSWDQLLPPEEHIEWMKWLQDVKNLAKIKIERCFKPAGAISAVELHHFSDASQVGYGACSYIRQISEDGRVTCNLLFSKARVAPLKKRTTIPRLELQGALTAVKIANTLKKELNMKFDSETFWSDSQIALGYIRNESKRFHTFVANRVSEIKQSTTSEQWQHVATADNPADLASRGCWTNELVNNKWRTGPDFLQKLNINEYIRKNEVTVNIHDDDKEVRKVTLSTTTERNMSTRFNKYSDMKKLVRGIAILKACIRDKRKHPSHRAWKIPVTTVSDLEDAEEFIIKEFQKAAYAAEEKEPNLIKLSPQFDAKGILRVGGRARNAADWTHNHKHPDTG